MENQKYPIGIQDFAKLREENYVYVDKTKYIYQMLQGAYYFLSRPRRFGKSLLVNTFYTIYLKVEKTYLKDFGLKISALIPSPQI